MAKQGGYPQELRERAIRMVQDGRKEYPSQWQAVASIAGKLGMHPVTLHEWVKRAEIDAGQRAGLTTEERERLKQVRLGLVGAIRPQQKVAEVGERLGARERFCLQLRVEVEEI